LLKNNPKRIQGDMAGCVAGVISEKLGVRSKE
jgi:hypothetical protein